MTAAALTAAACVAPPGDPRQVLERRASVKVVDGDATLGGSSTSSCSSQEPPSGDGDRWCVFSRPTVAPDLVELWVVDVSAAARGAVPRCDGTDARCLRLSQTAPRRTPSAFEGDTLIVYADAVSSPDAPYGPYLGPIAAWRPGWRHTRTLSSGHGVTCGGHPHAAVAACLDDPETDAAGQGSVHVRAGVLDGEEGGPLPALAGTWPFVDDQTSAWQLGFSPDGATFGLSGPEVRGGVESLRLVPTSATAGRRPAVVIDDIESWRVSNGGQRIYFARPAATGRALWAADFPSGNDAVMVSPRIEDYWLQGQRSEDRGVVLFEKRGDVVTAFELVRDDAAVKAPLTVFTYDDVIDDWAVSADLRYTVWADASFVGRVVRNADLAGCLMNPSDGTPIYKPTLLADASTMFWKEYASGGGAQDAYYAAPERCAEKRRFAQTIDFFTPIGTGGLVFGDGLDDLARTVTLKVAAVSGGGPNWPEDAVRVQGGVKTPVTILGSTQPLLVFESTGDGARGAGIYVYGPLPF